MSNVYIEHEEKTVVSVISICYEYFRCLPFVRFLNLNVLLKFIERKNAVNLWNELELELSSMKR